MEAAFKSRTRELAKRIARFVLALPSNRVTEVFGKQLLRSGSSVGANYRFAYRARSDAEMAAKLGISEEEADESQYWLELLMESGFGEASSRGTQPDHLHPRRQPPNAQ